MAGLIQKISDYLKRHALMLAVANAIVLSFCCYCLNNFPLFTGENLNQYAWLEWARSKVKDDSPSFPQPLCINVANDNQLVEITDEFGMPKGNKAITDRSHLLKLLQMLDYSKSYKYIFFDIRFESDFNTPADSALFSKILSMDNICIPNHKNIEIADSALLPKTAFNDYYATIVATNFTRYEFLQRGQPSMPLKAYSELTGNSISRWGPFYFSDHSLCQNSLFLEFPLSSHSQYDEAGNLRYYNLGSDILDLYSLDEFAEWTKDKYILVGDFEDDLHDTYSGMQPGTMITYHAFTSLMQGKHKVSWRFITLFLLVYFFISYFLFAQKSLIDRLPWIKRSRLLRFIAAFIGYSFVLYGLSCLLYLLFGIAISYVIPSFVFSTEKLIISKKLS